MKNILIIDIDTDRAPQIQLRKPEDVKPPTTPEEASASILQDISCVFETLRSLINVCDKSGYASKEDLVKASIAHLNAILITREEPKSEVKIEEKPAGENLG